MRLIRLDPAYPVAKCFPVPSNPKKHDISFLRTLVRGVGQHRTVVVRESTGHVLAGNGWWEATRQEGLASLAVSLVECSDEEAQSIVASDNKSQERGGGYDATLLAELLQEAANAGRLENTGYDQSELDALLASITPPGADLLTDPDDVPDVPEPAAVISKLGDLWTLGDHRLLCGDSTKAEDVARLMAGAKADLLVTDPPYGVSYASKNRFLNAVTLGSRIQEPILGDHDSPEDTSKLWDAAFGAIRPHMRPGAPYYVTGPQGKDLLLLLLLSLKNSGFPLYHMLIWVKNNHVLGRCDYHYQHEPILYGWVEGGHQFYGGHSQTSLWEIDKPSASKLHPTMKPVELMARAIRNSSAPSEIALDPFAGSGSSLIAAHQEGRRCYAMELAPEYADVICRRFQQATGIASVLESTGEEVDFSASPPKLALAAG